MDADGIMASVLVVRLQRLIEEHGDLRVVGYLDHAPVLGANYEEHSWIGTPEDDDKHPAFELV